MTSFKPAARQLVAPVLLGCLTATALLYAGLAASGDPMGAGELGQMLLAATAACAVVVSTAKGYGVSLTEEALVVGGRHRPIPRADIHRLEVQRSLGVSRIAVYTADGRRTMLRAPMSFLDREFEHKAGVITAWWQGGSQGRVGAPGRQPTAHRTDVR
ncbi:hypothetical protein [Streptomyces sp. 4F14]|uniref:hypothetical protein n=1 Tax=Streptomyces sp. 4F14 TaxID=3394380 RepID=UPI003A874C46